MPLQVNFPASGWLMSNRSSGMGSNRTLNRAPEQERQRSAGPALGQGAQASSLSRDFPFARRSEDGTPLASEILLSMRPLSTPF
jgi:hypothetical protein